MNSHGNLIRTAYYLAESDKNLNVLVLIQLQADAMVHLKYSFRILSILERTKNSTKTSNTLFERSDSGLLKS